MRVVQQEWIPSLQGVHKLPLRPSAAAFAWTMGTPSMDRPPTRTFGFQSEKTRRGSP